MLLFSLSQIQRLWVIAPPTVSAVPASAKPRTMAISERVLRQARIGQAAQREGQDEVDE